MIDSRFYHSHGPLSLKRISTLSDAELILPREKKLHEESLITGLASLEEATSSDLTMLHNLKYKEIFTKSKAGACFISPDMIPFAPSSMALLVTPKPHRAYALAASTFYPEPEGYFVQMPHPIHPSVEIGENVTIEYGVIIKEHAKIGKNTRIGANSVIGAGVIIGEGCTIAASVTISHALIGNHVTIFPGARLGQAGFGFVMDELGHIPVPQLGRVIIEDYVEIGANTTIDRGSLRDTIIGQGSRLDNLVMIGHNVVIGKGCVLVAQVGIAGSTTLGNYVIAAGQAGISGHLKIGNRVKIAAQGGVTKDIKDGDTVGGTPAVPLQDYLRQSIMLSKITKDYQKKKEK
ncbi:MAG: UDP-3-O-(3-hydroxymyristoyl)glucosamine N-acyltransferase [Candidatus Paracaedimonas acanthamoebae]|uniref:UDP-3-O-acylglucosamine N-acyltransferase n=1 Tax=Candidatus Paracaedimonas acanthamoebae TaxID=244581 RepID=A0A8J7PKN2_9PROT|nr:UDP-3-O-(3-hydroxymyristoyl)glucosamine N-acyltransferase [Candidatus Paracaedimonas acanthamoebae]